MAYMCEHQMRKGYQHDYHIYYHIISIFLMPPRDDEVHPRIIQPHSGSPPKGAACSELNVGGEKRQWPDAGIALVIPGGLSCLPIM